MPIDPSMLAKSIGTLTDLHPDQDLPATLHQAVITAKQLFDADAAGIMLADMEGKLRWASASDQRAQTLEDNQEVFAAGPCSEAFSTGKPAVMHDASLERRWGEIALTFVEVQIRSGLSVPVELGGGPIGTLDLYAASPRGWNDTEITASQAYAGIVASLLLAAAKAELSGALADQLQTALDSRGLIERAKGALMERERLDDQEAFTHLRRAARVLGTQAVRGGSRGRRRQASPTRAGQAHSNPDRIGQRHRLKASERRRSSRMAAPHLSVWLVVSSSSSGGSSELVDALRGMNRDSWTAQRCR
jgi:GAF domain-containing protein